jgi:hypothetical protein
MQAAAQQQQYLQSMAPPITARTAHHQIQQLQILRQQQQQQQEALRSAQLAQGIAGIAATIPGAFNPEQPRQIPLPFPQQQQQPQQPSQPQQPLNRAQPQPQPSLQRPTPKQQLQTQMAIQKARDEAARRAAAAEEADGLGDGVEDNCFANFATDDLEAAGLLPHPDKIAETTALASVSVPTVSYKMSLPSGILTSELSGLRA